MIANVFVPVIKSKTGHIMSKDNYRPIAFASVVSKVAEIVIYIIVSLVILILVRTSLDLKETTALINVGLYALKEIIDAYRVLVVSSLGFFWMRARHLTESIIPFYSVNCETGESPNMLFEFCPTGTKISRCVYAGEGLILLFSVLLMGFVKAAFCRLTCLIYMSTTSVWLLMLAE